MEQYSGRGDWGGGIFLQGQIFREQLFCGGNFPWGCGGGGGGNFPGGGGGTFLLESGFLIPVEGLVSSYSVPLSGCFIIRLNVKYKT